MDIEVKKIEPERCPECGKTHVRTFLVKMVVFEIVLCLDCLNELKYAIFEHTRWP